MGGPFYWLRLQSTHVAKGGRLLSAPNGKGGDKMQSLAGSTFLNLTAVP